MLTYLIDTMLPFFYQGPKSYAPFSVEDLIEYARLALAAGGPSGIRFLRLAHDLIETDHPALTAWLSSLGEEDPSASNHPLVRWICFRRSLRHCRAARFVFA